MGPCWTQVLLTASAKLSAKPLLAMNDTPCTHAETLVLEVVTTIVERYGKKLTPEALQASLEALHLTVAKSFHFVQVQCWAAGQLRKATPGGMAGCG